jgi:hypothetical protein
MEALSIHRTMCSDRNEAILIAGSLKRECAQQTQPENLYPGTGRDSRLPAPS